MCILARREAITLYKTSRSEIARVAGTNAIQPMGLLRIAEALPVGAPQGAVLGRRALCEFRVRILAPRPVALIDPVPGGAFGAAVVTEMAGAVLCTSTLVHKAVIGTGCGWTISPQHAIVTVTRLIQESLCPDQIQIGAVSPKPRTADGNCPLRHGTRNSP